MPPKKAPAGAKKKPAKGAYQMPEHLPAGSVLTDLAKQQWKIGPSIGTGGFGEIYSACSAATAPKKTDDYQFVVKIEPHNNGPLFVEMHFYMRNAKLADIESFRRQQGLATLGMPHFVGSGSHELNTIKHRFVVMPRYGKDISKFWLEGGRRLPQHTAFRLAVQMLDVLEYIHHCTYVHADLKGANMLLGAGKAGATQAYLVDFGLACHYTTAADFKPDPKKMHNGTIEYTSRDAHCGVPTRRGDLEILAYNLVHWLGGELPWETNRLLENAPKVHEAKKTFMEAGSKGLAVLFAGGCAEPVLQFFKYVNTLKFNEAPDHAKCRRMFEVGLKALGKTNSGDLDFKQSSSKTTVVPAVTPKKVARKRTAVATTTSAEDDSPPSARKTSKKTTAANPVAKRNGRRRSADVQCDEDDGGDSDSSAEVLPAKKARSSRPQNDVEKENKTATSNGTPASTSKTHTEGSMTVNNDVQSKGRKKKDTKTYEFNFELDVSLDADVVINVKRNPRKGSSAKKTPVTPLQKVLSGSVAAASVAAAAAGVGSGSAKSGRIDSDEEIDASPDVTPVASLKRVLKKDVRRLRAGGTPTTSSRKSPRN